MTCKLLNRRGRPHQLPQCSVAAVDLRDNFFGKQRRRALAGRTTKDTERCMRAASVEINGKPYCSAHGGRLAIEKLVELAQELNLGYEGGGY